MQNKTEDNKSFPILVNLQDIAELERAALLIEGMDKGQPETAGLAKSIWSIVATARHAMEVDEIGALHNMHERDP